MRSPYLNGEPDDMNIQIKGLESTIFYYGKGMQAKCIQSSKVFLGYVGRTYGKSEKESIIKNELIILDAEKPESIKTEADFKKMDYADQEIWRTNLTNWCKLNNAVKRNLSKAYSVLWDLCHLGLQQKILSDKEYKRMTKGDVGELYRLVQKICHGNSSTSNPLSNLLEAWYNFMLIRGDAHALLVQYLDAFQKKLDVIMKCGGCFNTPGFRDLYMDKLEVRGHQHTSLYKVLQAWKTEEEWELTAAHQKPPTEARDLAVKSLVELYAVHIYIKRAAGPRYDYYRNNLHNNYNKGIANYPETLSHAHHIMDHHRMVHSNGGKTISEDKNTSKKAQVYQQDFESVQTPANVPSNQQVGEPEGFKFCTGVVCFKCDREGHLTKECWYKSKEGGMPLNNKEAINLKYKEKIASKRRDHKDGSVSTASTASTLTNLVSASNNYVLAQTAMTVEEYLDVTYGESDQESYLQTVDASRKQVITDFTRSGGLLYATQEASSCLYEVLLDSCSTCNIFVDKEFLRNIRKSSWTLILKTQAGECNLNMVGDLPGVGTVWYYP